VTSAEYWRWGDAVDPRLLASLGRHRGYDLCSLPDLLRFVRNLNQHFADQTPDAIAVLRQNKSVTHEVLPPLASVPPVASAAAASAAHPSVDAPLASIAEASASEAPGRDEIVGKLREAAANGDAVLLRAAVAGAEAAGLAHEASLGRRRLAHLLASDDRADSLGATAANQKGDAAGAAEEEELALWRASVLRSTAKQRGAIEAYVTRLFPSLVMDLWQELGTDF
jgi:hypothetical protein